MVLRFRNGRRNPPPIQRMESDDLMAAVFPQAAACQENVSGPVVSATQFGRIQQLIEKGIGEGGAIAPPAAIANAVNDALRRLAEELAPCRHDAPRHGACAVALGARPSGGVTPGG